MNKSVVKVTEAIRMAQIRKGMDPLNNLELDNVIAAVESLPHRTAVEKVAVPHHTRPGIVVFREGQLVVSATVQDGANPGDASVKIQHVKVLQG